MRGVNRGNHKCFMCGDDIDGKVFYETDGYGTEAFCEECHDWNLIKEEARVFLKDLEDPNEYDPDAVLLVLARWQLSPQYAAARGIGGTAAIPVVFVQAP